MKKIEAGEYCGTKYWMTGCYFDGAFGHYYTSCRIITFAEGLGWVGTYDGEVMSPLELPETTPDNDENFDFEWLVETIDEIEEWLNENTLIRENEYWCWSDGDFGLWLHDEEGERV